MANHVHLCIWKWSLWSRRLSYRAVWCGFHPGERIRARLILPIVIAGNVSCVWWDVINAALRCSNVDRSARTRYRYTPAVDSGYRRSFAEISTCLTFLVSLIWCVLRKHQLYLRLFSHAVSILAESSVFVLSTAIHFYTRMHMEAIEIHKNQSKSTGTRTVLHFIDRAI